MARDLLFEKTFVDGLDTIEAIKSTTRSTEITARRADIAQADVAIASLRFAFIEWTIRSDADRGDQSPQLVMSWRFR